eukprot:2382260-Pleurochrysis_carterae.AAC.1
MFRLTAYTVAAKPGCHVRWCVPPADPAALAAWVGLFRAHGATWRFPREKLRCASCLVPLVSNGRLRLSGL